MRARLVLLAFLVGVGGCGDDDRPSVDEDGGTGDDDGGEHQDGSLEPLPDFAPEFTSTPVTTATEGEPYYYAALATEVGGEALQFRIGEGPEGMTVDEFGLVKWTPGPDDAGQAPVTLVAADPAGQVATQEYVITVTAGIRAPEIVSYPSLLGVAGTTWRYTPEAQDPDDTRLTWTVVDGPSGMEFSGDRLEWNVPADAGGNYPVTIRVTDPTSRSATQAFSVGVLLGGDPPIVSITSPAPTSQHSSPATVLGTATDADLTGYELLACPQSDSEVEQCKIVHRGLAPVEAGELGLFDPRLIQNGGYFLTLVAHDAGGRSSRTAIPVLVIGYGKEGTVNLAFVDLDVDGIVTLRRIFRSTAVPGGDFGDQWTSEWSRQHGDFSIQTDIDSGWQVDCSIGGCDIHDVEGEVPHAGALVVGGRAPYDVEFHFQDTGSGVSSIHTAIPFAADPTGRLEVDLLIPNTETVATEVWVWRDTGTITWTDDPFSQPFRPWIRVLTEDLTLITYDSATKRIIEIRTPYGVVADMENGRPSTLSRHGEDYIHIEYDGDFIRRATDLTSGETVEYERDENDELVLVRKSDGDETFEYDRFGRLLRWQTPESPTPTEYTYDTDDRVIEMRDDRGSSRNEYLADDRSVLKRDPLGRESRIERDELGRIVEMENPLHGVTQMFYDDDRSRPTRTVDPMGRESRYTYDNQGRVLTAIDPMGRTRTFTYAGGAFSGYTDPAGNAFTLNADDRERPVEYLVNGEVAERYEYPDDSTVEVYEPDGDLKWARSIDERGRPVQTTDAEGHISTYEYLADGTVRFTDGTTGDVSEWQQDLHGRVTEIPMDEAGGMLRYEYERNKPLPSRIITPDGEATIAFGPSGDVSNITVGGEQVQGRRFDSMRRLASVRAGDASGAESYRYDELDRVSQIVRPEGTQSFTYDPVGRVERIDEADGSSTDLAHDDAGRVVAVMSADSSLALAYDPDGRVTSLRGVGDQAVDMAFEHDAFGNVTRRTVNGVSQEFRYALGAKPSESAIIGVTLGDGQTFDYERDDEDHITSVTDGDGNTVTYGYGELGMESQTDGEGNQILFEQGLFGVNARTWPSGAREQWMRDDNGQLTAHVAPDGSAVRIDYASDRVVKTGPTEIYEQVFSSDGVLERVRIGDTEQSGRTLRFSESGPVGRVLLDDVSAALSYTDVGEVAEITIVDVTGAAHETQYTYDDAGRLARIVDPMGGETVYVYDERNRLAEQRVSTASGTTTVTTFEYEGVLTRPSITTTRNDSGVIASTTVGYDDLGRVVRRHVVSDGIDHDERYTYDRAGRIASVASGSGTTRLTYDAIGNLLQEDGPSGRVVYTYNEDSQLVERRAPDGTTGYDYDTHGSLVRVMHPGGGQTRYTYDDLRHLQSISGPDGEYRFQTTASGKLLGWTGPEGERRCLPALDASFLNSRTCLATWEPGVPSSLRIYVPTVDATASMHQPNNADASRYSYPTDDHGSLGGLFDNAGHGVAGIAYGFRGQAEAHGGESLADFPTFQNTWSFGSHQYFGARYFDTTVGRSVTRDPVDAPIGATQVSPYRLLANSPWNNTDKTGAQDTLSLSISMSEGSALDAINWGAVGAALLKVGLYVGGAAVGGWGLAKAIAWYQAAVAAAAAGTTLTIAIALTDAEVAGQIGDIFGEAARFIAEELAWHANIAARLCRMLDPLARGMNALKRAGISVEYAYMRDPCGRPMNHPNGSGRPGAVNCLDIVGMGARAIAQLLDGQIGIDIMMEYTRGSTKWQQGIELKETDTGGGTPSRDAMRGNPVYQTVKNCRLMSRNPDQYGTPTGLLVNGYFGSRTVDANFATFATACFSCWSNPLWYPVPGDYMYDPTDPRCQRTYPRGGPRAGSGALYATWNAVNQFGGGNWTGLPN